MGDALARLVQAALAEDLGPLGVSGDVTASATVPADRVAAGRVVARQHGVASGAEAAGAVFTAADAALAVTEAIADGTRVEPGDVLLAVRGPARSLLAAERTALNLLGHCCGVATITARFVATVAGTPAVIRDTRKILPGLRDLDKAAVVAGGGHNHRRDLTDGILIKDNHAAAAGGVGAATRAALAARAGDGSSVRSVQVEVDSLAELDAALDAGAVAVLFDNFDVATLRTAVERCRRGPSAVFTEASGGVTLDTVAAIAATGVDAIAVGALTHSAPALDVGLDVESEDVTSTPPTQ